MKNFDPEAVGGFKRDHVIGMDLKAMTGFEHDHVKNLDVEAKVGFGDKVPDFEDFSVDIRRELVDDSEMLLGGIGSFDDLAKLATADSASLDVAELKELGWDKAEELIAKAASIEIGTETAPVTIPDNAAAKALAAFAAVQ
jgi:hypothetical protein